VFLQTLKALDAEQRDSKEDYQEGYLLDRYICHSKLPSVVTESYNQP